jgi:small conductance mechanosensitive channel
MLFTHAFLPQEGTDQAAETAAGTESLPPEGDDSTLLGSTDEAVEMMIALKDWAIEFAPTLIGAVLTLLIGLWISKLLARGVEKGLGKANMDPMLGSFLAKLIKMVLTAIVLVSVVGQLGVETTSFAAILAAAGFAIGMALSGTLGNFAAGVMILLFRPFKTGHFVEVAGHAGVVENINVFMTEMRTGDNKQILIPNSEITAGSITNYSAKDTRRVDLVIGISYDDDIKKAHEVLNRVLDQNDKVLKDPAWTVAVSELGADSVNFVVRPWVKSADYWGVYFDLTETIKLTFDKEGLNFPYPQRDVHIHQQQS